MKAKTKNFKNALEALKAKGMFVYFKHRITNSVESTTSKKGGLVITKQRVIKHRTECIIKKDGEIISRGFTKLDDNDQDDHVLGRSVAYLKAFKNLDKETKSFIDSNRFFKFDKRAYSYVYNAKED